MTSTAPAECAGVVARSCVSESTVNEAAALPSKVTAVAPVRFVPWIVRMLPPAAGPAAGATVEIVGTRATYVNPPVRVAVPPGVVTTTLTAPAACAGVVAVTWVAESTVNDAAAVPPKVTALAPVRFVPVSVTTVPPSVDPEAGATEAIDGGGTTNVNPAVFVAVPPGVVTATSTAPAA